VVNAFHAALERRNQAATLAPDGVAA
jgi:hypothetical protein